MNPTSAEPFITVDSVWLPKQNSTIAPAVDFAWDIVMFVSIAFFMLLMGMMVYFAIRYRRRSDFDVTSDRDHNARLEFLWTIVPLAIVIGLFFVGYRGFLYMSVPPAESYEINVTGQKWSWTFTYPNGVVSNELTVPAGRPIKLIMSSQDVIHSFYVPEFRVKRDVIPGLYTTVWFEAREPAESTLFCTEYCGGGGDGRQGSGHSGMWTAVHVLSEPDFDTWMQSQEDDPNMPPAEKGAKLHVSRGCAGCHSLDGTRGNGPSFKGLFGRQEQMADGEQIIADENYLRESILQANRRIVAGYQPIMPSFEGQLTDNEVMYLIEFIKTVK
jgi:cytochrome c oxidase subunit II